MFYKYYNKTLILILFSNLWTNMKMLQISQPKALLVL